jgi:DNA-binding MarR family transcriptional regulator
MPKKTCHHPLDIDLDTHWPILNTTTMRIIRALYRNRKFIFTHDIELVERSNLTWGQLETLVALRITSMPYQMSPTALYDAVQVTSGGLTKILNGLEQRDLIARIDNPEDRRSRLVCLTSNGKTLVEKIIDRLSDTNNELLVSIFNQDEREQLDQLLGRLLEALEERHCSSSECFDET